MKKGLIILIALLIVMISSALFNFKISGYYSLEQDKNRVSSVFLEANNKDLKITIIPGEEGYSNLIQVKDKETNNIIDKITIEGCEIRCQDISQINYNIEGLSKGVYQLLVFDNFFEIFSERDFKI